MENGIFILGIVIIVGFIGNFLYNRTKIPESIFLMLIGILIGPVFDIVPGDFFLENSSFLITLALVIVLLDSGLTLDLGKILTNTPLAFFFTILVMISTMAIVAAVTHFAFGWSWINGLFLGIIGSGTTTITISHLVEKMSVGKNTKSLLILESIVNDITLILGTSILIAFVSLGGGTGSIVKIVFNELFLSILLGLTCALIWVFIFIKYIHGNNLGYVFTLGISFALFAFVEYIGFNGAIAVLTFSLLLGNYTWIVEKVSAYSNVLSPIENDIKIVRNSNIEITFLMRTLFFVFLGVVFNVKIATTTTIIFVIVVVLAEILSRYAAARTLCIFEPRFRPAVPVITALVASGFTSTLVAFASIKAGINIPNLREIVLLEVIFTTLFAIIAAGILERKFSKKRTETF